ncbi:acetylglutamate kinase [Paenibacillus yanchengensis]|uniref:Acetylglutamate kinase n=1 Tax=Paenibacillus yanchengensis TaxID=2035833 RepID=A0ABW4YNB0_9BACL
MQQRFVMKCGGSTLAALPERFFVELRELQTNGHYPVIVHGGGPAISELLDVLGIESEFVNGLRKTSESVLDVVEMVLSGKINKEIVRKIEQSGAHALGISGIDGQLLLSQPVANADQVGFVGEVVAVKAKIIEGIINMGYMPVIAPLGIDEAGQRYNINADTAAGAVASFLDVEQMIVVTDVPGVMKQVDGEMVTLPQVTVAEIEAMIASGEIYGGMIPKVRAAIACIQGKVQKVVIVSGKEEGVLTKAVVAGGVGTTIVR